MDNYRPARFDNEENPPKPKGLIMAFISGITVPAPPAPIVPDVSEEVGTTLKLFRHLGFNFDEDTVAHQLTGEFTRLRELGEGRLYVRLPSSHVSFAQLVSLANKLAKARGFKEVWQWPNLYKPGTESESLTVQELDGSDVGFDARIALYSKEPSSGYDRLLHFKGLPYDDRYKERSYKSTQLESSRTWAAEFTAAHYPSGASVQFLDHHDFLVNYIMDLIREVEAEDVILAEGFLRIPLFGRRTVDGVSLVGDVDSVDGRARFDGSGGDAVDDFGVGFSVGFTQPLET